MRRLFPILSLVCLLAVFSACTESGTAVIQDKQNYTIDDQGVIGDYLAEAIKNDPTKYDVINANAYPEVYTYLNTMMQSAVVTEHVMLRGDFIWEIIPIVDNEEIYAYSTPGGKIVVSTAMLKFLQYESELLALLSGEIYFSDVDLHTAAMVDQFSGIRLGSIVLGSDTKDPEDLISFLRNQDFSEEEVLAADKRAIAVMCPFNYDVQSLKGLVGRSRSGVEMDQWNQRRPRPDNWEELFADEISKCDNQSSDRFRTRYQDFLAKLP